MATKAVDPAFHNVAQKPGTEIWRIENFQPVPLPKSDYGKFYMGDSYIVLQTSSGRGGAYLYDIHFWLGKDTSQDEAGTAAIKTVELDAQLGGRAVQHRELQGFETDKFLSYFKPCIIPLEGGIASGFKTPEEEEFETRLYICKGKRVVKVKQVPFARSSLNHDDVFILDTKDKIFQFNGANSNIQERAKALEVVQYLKDKYHEGTCSVAFVDDGKLQAESDSGEFWVLFGGFAPIGRKVVNDDDAIPEPTPPKLYSVTGGELGPLEGELAKGMLENTNCYLLDCGDEIYVWFGRATQVDERKSACQAADDFVTSQGRPKATRITRHMQGYESQSFKVHFNSWPVGPATSTPEEGRGKVSAFLKQQGAGAKGAAKGAPASEEVPPLLAAGGKIDVWRVDGNAKTPVDKDDIGKFYSGDCYILLYTYHSSDKKEDFYLCWWAGKDSIQEERKMAAKLANTMCNSMKGRPALGRMYQGKEPPQFLALFQPMAIFFTGGMSSGYKQHLQDQGLKDETYAAEGAALFQISGSSQHNSKALQVEKVATSLNTHECFVLQTTSAVFTWQGSQSTFEQQQVAVKVAEVLKPGGPLKHAKEGTETSVFWGALGGKQAISSQKPSQNNIKDPHLYLFSTSKGNFQVEEIYNFTQDDLLTEDVLIFDSHAEVFVWVGQTVDTKTKQTAVEIGESYVERASTTDGLSKQVPLYKVTEANEPCFFTAYFGSWDSQKASAYGNSFQKKVVTLFGITESSKSNASSQGGHTQRASALAALNSAFNTPAVDKASMSPGKSEASGGPTQRASALAALNSAFGSSDKKTASPRLSTSGGSQRAAAMAALSQALTAEKKDGSSPSQDSGSSPLAAEGGEGTEAPEAAEAAEAAEGDSEENVAQENNSEQESIKDTYSYEELRSKSENPVTGIDYKRREAYLSDDEFKSIFGITKEDFYEQPRWKQDIQKKKHDLF